GSATDANNAIRAKLIGPVGDNDSSFLRLAGGQSLVNLTFDDQSPFRLCNPLGEPASDCNYLQGATPGGDGVATGSVHADLNPVFRGLSPKGTWRLVWWDASQDAKTRTIGTATLEVRTGKKYAKEQRA
ncbi:MAG: hypothetical protein ACXWGV_12080, partial [Solirubrobacterales bacterium]